MSEVLNLKIFSVFHKDFAIPKVKYVQPIHAGKALSSLSLNIPGDDTGENISILNPNFCELTVLYHIWKNNTYLPANYWGLCHYRRYFTLQIHWSKIKRKKIYHFPADQNSFNKIFTDNFYNTLQVLLKPNSIVVPIPYPLIDKHKKAITIKNDYLLNHDPLAWDLMETTISNQFPEYIDSLNVVSNKKEMISCNMMIAHHIIWDQYLEWLFKIMFSVKENYKIPIDQYQARSFGFLSERLFNIYLYHHANKISTNYLPIAVLS